MQKSNISDQVRDYVEEHYVRPARRAGERRFTVVTGEVHKALRFLNRIPLVCGALRRARFLESNGLRIVEDTGPASGMSTTVRITYEFVPRQASHPNEAPDPLLAMRGLLRDVFQELGGGENFIKSERKAWGE